MPRSHESPVRHCFAGKEGYSAASITNPAHTALPRLINICDLLENLQFKIYLNLHKRLDASDSPSKDQTMNVTLSLVRLSHEQIRHMSANTILITNCVPTKNFL